MSYTCQSSFLPQVSLGSRQVQPAPMAAPRAKRRKMARSAEWRRGKMAQGMATAPSLPTAEQSPKAMVRTGVGKHSVVQGYSIWYTSFMKKRAREEIRAAECAANRRWHTALPTKKQSIECLRPHAGRSIRYRESRRQGASPRMVRVYDQKDLLSLLRMKGRMISCPQQMKLMKNQQALRAAVERRWAGVKSQSRDEDLYYGLSMVRECFQGSVRGGEWLLLRSNWSMTAQAQGYCLCARRQRGDYLMTKSAPQRTRRLGRALSTIIARQLPWLKSRRKTLAKRTPYTLPREIAKLRRRRPLPRQARGADSAYMLQVMAMVKPKLRPQSKRAISICHTVLTKQKKTLTDNCIREPMMIRGLRPYWSASLPLRMEPMKIPKQKIELRRDTVEEGRVHSSVMTGVRKELRTSCVPSFMSMRQRKRKGQICEGPKPILLSNIQSNDIQYIGYIMCNIFQMEFKVGALSGELALNNAVYLSPTHQQKCCGMVRIQNRNIKCLFSQEVQPTVIRMSKNYRQYLSTGQSVRVSFPTTLEREQLSYIELQLSQVKPRLLQKSTFDKEKILQCLKGMYFNPLQTKYLEVGGVVFGVRATKCLPMLTGEAESKKAEVSGYLVPQTQIELRVAADCLLQGQGSEVSKSLFRPDFSIADMGIGGLDSELFNIFRRTFASRRYSTSAIKRFGIKHVKGILLHGPPGTGKTLIARQLAKALNVKDLKIVNGPQVFSKFVGESEENVRKLFKEAREDEDRLGDKSPLHIIVFDEIDAMCKQRGMNSGVGGQVTDQVVNQLLTNIDGVNALNNILVIGMTNRKDLIDQAVLRAGRFEVHIEVSLPDEKGREEILSIHTRKLRENGLLGGGLGEIAKLTKNFTGAELEALVKCASSYCLSRSTNILDFSRELVINQAMLRVEMQDFVKALTEVKAQFGVDEEKFGFLFREKCTNYGVGFDRVMTDLQQLAGNNTQKRSVLLHGRAGCGKTTLAVNFIKHCSFSYLKIISPQNYIGLSEAQKVRSMSKIFQDAYRTTNACIVIDGLQRLIEHCLVGRRFTNSVLQALLLLLEKIPPKQSCKLLIVGTTSAYHSMQEMDLCARFDLALEVECLSAEEVSNVLAEKYGVKEEVRREVGNLMNGCTITELLELAEIVSAREDLEEWKYYWKNIINGSSSRTINE